MSDDLFRYDLGFTAFEIDHLCDPEDDAEKLAILLEERVAEKVAVESEPWDEIDAEIERRLNQPMRLRGMRYQR